MIKNLHHWSHHHCESFRTKTQQLWTQLGMAYNSNNTNVILILTHQLNLALKQEEDY